MAANKKDKQDKSETTQKKEAVPAVIEEKVSAEDFSSELNEPCWSVISFDKCEAKGLTYEEAEQKMSELAAQKISGLCIVSDEAAARIGLSDK